MPCIRTQVLALALLALAGGSALAQNIPQMPSKEEIERRVEEELSKLPSKKAESEVIAIEYKELPTDPVSIVQKVAAGQLPPGMNAEQASKQFLPMARPYIEKYAQKLGTLTPKSEVKYKSTTLSEGVTYEFGLIMDDLLPIGLRIAGEDLKRPLTIPLRTGAGPSKVDPMQVEVLADKSSAKKFKLVVHFGERLGATPTTFKAK